MGMNSSLITLLLPHMHACACTYSIASSCTSHNSLRLALIPIPSFLNHNCVLQIRSISLKCYMVHIFPGWEFSLEKINYIEKKEKGKSELLFLDHNVLKCDLPSSLRLPSCPVFFFFLHSFFSFVRGGLRREGKSYLHKIALSRNSKSVFGLAEKKSYMNLGSGC